MVQRAVVAAAACVIVRGRVWIAARFIGLKIWATYGGGVVNLFCNMLVSVMPFLELRVSLSTSHTSVLSDHAVFAILYKACRLACCFAIAWLPSGVDRLSFD